MASDAAITAQGVPDGWGETDRGPPAGRFAALVAGQRGHLFLWSPVCLAIGIGTWFSLRFEPGPAEYLAGLIAAAALVAGARRMPEPARPLAVGAALILVGAVLAGVRAERIDAPVIGFRYYGPVEGRVIEIDKSGSEKVRLTLDRVRLDNVRAPPTTVRLSLHWDGPQAAPPIGARVATTAHLSPPGGPVEPGGFDFRRMAYFEGLGGIGYTRNPVVPLAAPQAGELRVAKLRRAISIGVRERMGGERGAFAAAILTGDRSGMPEATLEALRHSNLAHLLAISGLHMGLATGVVFAALRAILVAVPAAGLRLPARALAAAGALLAGAGYLALSGGTVPTERAFVMAAVVLGAVIAGRRALTLRAVAVAALVVLTLRPEALTGAGFAMSFAATTALVAVFAALRRPVPSRRHPALRWASALVISSAVAGAATAPIAAAQFNILSHWGLIANLVSVPIMGALVMPAAVLAAALWPIGLEGIGLALMAPGIDWILLVAHEVSSWPGAITRIPGPPWYVLPMLGLAGCVAALWIGRGRVLAVPLAAAAFGIWTASDRPALLISETGGLVGAMTAEGRALSRERGDGFAAGIWLENDGDTAPREVAAVRPPPGAAQGSPRSGPSEELWSTSLGALRVIHLPGKGGAREAGAHCRGGAVLVLNVEPDAPVTGDCTVHDPRSLRATGALSIDGAGPAPRLLSAAGVTGARRWAGTPPPPVSAFLDPGWAAARILADGR